ncbi:permease-like cell division protein FtsX [uncultured Neptuniibacter sp.]|uniref:permease-like cell division protein FtsX n=1 Tax=uncultured Neptuniibacter sp. TaxID=502143 RepID=UPI00262FEF60|nr:permease-like cell division protein FtsX [uncultured Neptuniibacter sp.]
MAGREPVKRGAERQQRPTRSSEAPATPPSKGAAKHKVDLSAHSKSWIRHHKHTALDSLVRLQRTPLPTLMTLAVLAIALALPGLMFVGLKNIDQISAEWNGEPKVSLYLHKTLTDQQAENFSQAMLLRPDLAGVELVTREQGLHEFQRISGFTDVLEFLDNNPLPAVVVVQPRESRKEVLLKLQTELAALNEVEEAVLDMVWVERLASFVALANRVVLVLGILLALSVLLVVGNTIRLGIENRKDEIQVAKLVGATDAWVKRPFIYTGFWFGLIGSLVAWLFVQTSLLVISDPVERLVALYQSDFQLQGLGVVDSLVLLFAGIILGLIGSKLAVGRHLREVEPQ